MPLSRRAFTGALVSSTALTSAALTAGCSSGGSGSDEPLTAVSIMAPFLTADAPAAGNEIAQKLSALVGKDLTINWVPNSGYGDKTNITLAGSDLPTLMVVQGKDPGFVKNAQAGAFWDLTDVLDDYPNLVSENPEVRHASSINGTVYGIYRARDVMRTAVMLRKDWLEQLGLAVPQTTDELADVARAFTEENPGGQGTTGLIIPKWPGGIGTASPYDAIETWYGAGNVWREDGGKLVPGFTTDTWRQAVEYERNLVQNGWVNADYATMDSVTWNDPFVNGKGGIIIDVMSRVGALVRAFRAADPATFTDRVAFTGNLMGPDGRLNALPTPGYSGFIAIPKAQVRTKEQLADVLKVLDAMASKEGQVLLNNGIEGTNFTVVDGRAQEIDTPEAEVLTDAVKSYAQLGTADAGYTAYDPAQPTEYQQQVTDEGKRINAADLEHAVYNPAAAYVSKTYVQKGAQLDLVMADARLKYLAGQIDASGIDDAIAQWKATGGDAIVAETNELYTADDTRKS